MQYMLFGMHHISVLFSQSCLTLCDPMDCCLPSSSVHWTFQARILEWVAISICYMVYSIWYMPWIVWHMLYVSYDIIWWNMQSDLMNQSVSFISSPPICLPLRRLCPLSRAASYGPQVIRGGCWCWNGSGSLSAVSGAEKKPLTSCFIPDWGECLSVRWHPCWVISRLCAYCP